MHRHNGKENMARAWYMDDCNGDQRDPHDKLPSESASLEHLKSIGVECFFFDVEGHEESEAYQTLRDERGYSYEDVITLSSSTPMLQPNYEEKIKLFFAEHLHTDEEIRYCMDGSGYYDVRDRDDRWIRIAFGKGDFIVLPAGLYHRFTMDRKNFIKTKRHFVGEPKWTEHNRPCDELPARETYLKKFVSQGS